MTACSLIRKTASQKHAFLHIFNTTTMSLFILINTLSLIRISFFWPSSFTQTRNLTSFSLCLLDKLFSWLCQPLNWCRGHSSTQGNPIHLFYIEQVTLALLQDALFIKTEGGEHPQTSPGYIKTACIHLFAFRVTSSPRLLKADEHNVSYSIPVRRTHLK